jgi:hypothetical protein
MTAGFLIYKISAKKYATIFFRAPAGIYVAGESVEWTVDDDQPEASFDIVELHN